MLDDQQLYRLRNVLDWKQVLLSQPISLNAFRKCFTSFMDQELFSKIESFIPSQIGKLNWAFLCKFQYQMNVDFDKLSCEPNIPNAFIDMFGEALNWHHVLRHSIVSYKNMKKFQHIWECD